MATAQIGLFMNWMSRSLLVLGAALCTVEMAPASDAVGVAPMVIAESNETPVTAIPAVISPEKLLIDNVEERFIPDTHVDPQESPLAAEEDDSDLPEDLSGMVAEMRSTEAGSDQLECLAGAIYFESKSEPLKGQLAVGHVIANRVKSGKYPSSYCGVVYQRGQFSFVRGHSMPHINRSGMQWKNAVAVANIVDRALQPSPVGKAVSFHARRVSPGWRMTKVATVGNHIFYR